jgi:hypothetical protein
LEGLLSRGLLIYIVNVGGGHTLIPCPLSVIWSSFSPPSLTSTSKEVEPASTEFSMSSFKAWTGATIISPAAILLTTSWSSAFEPGQMVHIINMLDLLGFFLVQ